MVRILKYLSMKALMGGPNFQISPATRKNLKLLPTMDARRKERNSKWKNPEDIVNTL